MELLDAHGEAMNSCDKVMHQVGPQHWRRPTPCADWSVRDLVNHLVYEQLWAPHLLAGATLDEVGDRFDGDVLGDDPIDAWERSAADARAAWTAPGALTHTVHVSSGPIDATEYGWQMTIDLAVHGWDLATAIGMANPIGTRLAARLLDFLRPQIDSWQGLGIFDPPVAAPRNAGAPTRLIALVGRNPRWNNRRPV